MGFILKRARIILAILFLLVGILALSIISTALKERELSNTQTVSGKIERLELSERNSATVNVFIEGDDQPYWIIPASFKQITKQKRFSKELISSYLPIGLDVNLQVVPFRDALSVVGIVAGDDVIMSIEESAIRAYEDSMVMFWMGATLISIFFPLGLLFLILEVLRIAKEKRMDSNEKNMYGIRKILYEYLGNTIAVFHEVSVFTLSIFVNEKLYSQHNSFVVSTQKMNIILQVNNQEDEPKEEVFTLTINGFGTLKLYNKDKLLIKKRQPFG